MNISRIHVGPVARTVLGVVAAAGLITVALCAPNALQILKPFLKDKKYSHRRAVQKNIESLVRTKLVKRSINAHGEVILELTQKGRWIHAMGHSNDKGIKWDKKWRLVIFDVPNTQSALRRELTRGMRMYGFEVLQKSVWIYPYPCDEFVEILRDHLELRENVIYLTIDSLESEKKWRKIFKL